MDGNGRIGRFLMNVMLASGGYRWTVIPVEKRADYMAALEAASVQGEIAPFSHFVAKCVGGTKKTCYKSRSRLKKMRLKKVSSRLFP